MEDAWIFFKVKVPGSRYKLINVNQVFLTFATDTGPIKSPWLIFLSVALLKTTIWIFLKLYTII